MYGCQNVIDFTLEFYEISVMESCYNFACTNL